MRQTPKVLDVQERARGPLSQCQIWRGSDFTYSRVGNGNRNQHRDILKLKPIPTSILRKPKNTETEEKYRKKENSVFADDDIYYINYMYFSPLKIRNEDVNVQYCCVKSFLQRETWLNVIFILVTNVTPICLSAKITGCIQTIQWYDMPFCHFAWLTWTFILRLHWAPMPTYR